MISDSVLMAAWRTLSRREATDSGLLEVWFVPVFMSSGKLFTPNFVSLVIRFQVATNTQFASHPEDQRKPMRRPRIRRFFAQFAKLWLAVPRLSIQYHFSRFNALPSLYWLSKCSTRPDTRWELPPQ
jgi:hypothetical protein